MIDNHFPDHWFINNMDSDEKFIELAWMTEQRMERIFWLAVRLSKCSKLVYSPAMYDPTRSKYLRPRFYAPWNSSWSPSENTEKGADTEMPRQATPVPSH